MALAAGGDGSKEGRGGKGDGKGEGSPGLMLPAELKPLLKLSRRRPVSCAVVLTKDRQGVALLDRKVKPRKLAATLKARAKAAGLELDPSTIRFGRASVDGASDSARVVFRVHKDAPAAMGRAMLPLLRPVGFQRCEFVTDAALEDEPEDGEGEEDEGGKDEGGPVGKGAAEAGQATPVQAPAAGAAPPGTVPASGLAAPAATSPPRAPLAAMVPPDVARGVAAAVAADPSRKPALAGLLAQVRVGVEGGDPGAAERGVAALRQALDDPAPARDAARGRGAGQPAPAPPAPAAEPRPLQADAALADLARAWQVQDGGVQNGAAKQGGPKAPALPASKSATPLVQPGDDEDLVTPVLSGDHWAPPSGTPPLPRQLPPGLVPEVQGPSPLPGGRTVAREGLRAGGRAAGRFLVTKPNPYLMVAGVVLLVAMELMPRADEGGGEATVTLRQHGAGGQPGREVATLHMDQTGALRAEPGGRGAVLGQMDPAGRITLTPAGEAYLAERAKGVQAPPAPGGFPGGAHDAMGNWTGPGAPGEGSPQPAAPGPADAAAPPRPGTPRLPQEPAPGQGSQRPAWLKEIEGIETFDADEREFVQEQAQGGMKHADIVRALDERRRGGVGALRRDQMTPEERRAEGKRRGARDKLDGVEVLDDQERAIAEAMAALGKPRIEIANALLERRGKLGTAPKPGQARPEVTQKIEEALKSDDPKVRLEGETASFLLKSGIDVANFQQGFGPGNSLGEIDVETDKAIIEATTENARKTRQIKERVNNPILNPDGKTPILYSENYGRRAQQEIESAGGRVARSPQELLDIIRKLGD